MNKVACKGVLGQNSYHVFFLNLANPLKIKIILCLRKGDRNVSEITRELNVEQSKVSHALRSLKNCRIVEAEKNGKERIYSLNKNTIVPILNLIDKHAVMHCKNKCCAMGMK